MLSFIKKDLLVLLRNRQELFLLLLMPLVLMAILGFALGGFMNSESPTIEAKIAVVNFSNEEQDIKDFQDYIKESGFSEEVEVALFQASQQLRPISILIDQVLSDEDFEKIIHVEHVDSVNYEDVMNDDEYSAVIEIPEKFTLQFLQAVLLDETHVENNNLLVYKNDGKEISANIVEDVLKQYQQHFTTMTILGKAGINIEPSEEKTLGVIETVTEKDPINSKQYYSIGMSVMFIMYVASFMSLFAYNEKKSHVFNRIVLANTTKVSYLLGTFVSTFIIAILQQGILYGVSALVFQIRWNDVGSLIVVNLSLSFTIAALATLLIVINFRKNSESASSIFGIVIAIFAFLGGSFTPISESSSLIGEIGNFTPNGAAMTSLLQIQQGFTFADIYQHVIYMLGLGLVILIVALVSFPKRGETV